MTIANFSDHYFTFLLSGKAEDLGQVCISFMDLTEQGVSLEDLQSAMSQAHKEAEILCMMVDKVSLVKRTDA